MASYIDQAATQGCTRTDIAPYSNAFLYDPYAYHSRLSDAASVFWIELLGIYGMARSANVSDALRDWKAFCSSRGVGLTDFAKEMPWRPPSLLLETDPPIHDRTRRLINRVVSLPAPKALRPDWHAKADGLVGGLVGRRIDAVSEFAEVFPLAIYPDTIGFPVEGRDHLLAYALATFNVFGSRNALFEKTSAQAAEAVEWVAIACRRENLTPDGWRRDVYRAADAGDCTYDEAERLVRSFISAGVDMTVDEIANLIHALALSLDQWRLLREDTSPARKAIEEGLRLGLTMQLFLRTTGHAVEVDGKIIPEGSKVLLFYAAINCDPRKWLDAERFDITRSASGHLVFRFGVHQCLGQMVARHEAETVLATLIPRVTEIRLTGKPKGRPNNTLHAPAELPVEFVAA